MMDVKVLLRAVTSAVKTQEVHTLVVVVTVSYCNLMDGLVTVCAYVSLWVLMRMTCRNDYWQQI